MFCFPYPQDTDVQPIRVPLMARTAYSITEQDGFSGFLRVALDAEKHRLDNAKSEGVQISESTINHSLGSILQSWLFFGLASEALGRSIRFEEFATPDPNGQRLSIDVRIPGWYWIELKARWDGLDVSLTASEFKIRAARLKTICQDVQTSLIYMDVLTSDIVNDELAKIFVSIYMLAHVVASVLDSSTRIMQTTTRSASTKLLKRRMTKNGWCAKRLNFVDASPIFYPEFYYLSSLRPPRTRTEDHSSCSSERCLVTNKLSQPLHRTDGCVCEDVVVPIDRLNKILASGGIPLIRITQSLVGKTELEVVPYTPCVNFVAISHVWADQQFGSAQNCLPKCQVKYLEEVLSSIPKDMNHWGFREWIENWRSSDMGKITPPNGAYEYFWLDSFCIPQASEHAELRNKAIELMNLIYAAASHTLVFDKALQAMDMGRRPGSMALGGRSTYYAPQDENLLEVVAYIYASNWMGRSWTLQEGILSRTVVFPLRESLAYLKLLRPHYEDVGDFRDFLMSIIPNNVRRSIPYALRRKINMKTKSGQHKPAGSEPFRESVRYQLFEHMKKSLYIEEYRDYARTPTDRATRFVKSHSLLQSRTTTQDEDIPLILMNMSCMNSNAISQSKTVGSRMKQLFYGLESLPTELLFSDCARLGTCTVDAWIPCEITPVKFKGSHTLKLGSEGFVFDTKKGQESLKFYLLSSAHQSNRFKLLLPDEEGKEGAKYDVEALQRFNDNQTIAPTSVCCIVLDGEPQQKGARCVVKRVVGSKYFLQFDCPLRLTDIQDSESPDDTQQDPKDECGAVSLSGNFILERNYEPQDLGISRPQNLEQSSDRLIVISQMICGVINFGERYLIRAFWGDENGMGVLFFIFYGLYKVKQQLWVENALNAFVHRAWVATYQPGWDPNGPWKWFWKFSNWEPPIPFRTLMKKFCSLLFIIHFQFQSWLGVATITLYWLPLYPIQELINMYITAVLGQMLLHLFL